MNHIEKPEQKVLVIPTEIYSRVSGYARPVAQFNKGKKEEFRQRVYLKVPEVFR